MWTMWNSIRRFWARYRFSVVVVVILAVGIARWDWYLSIWDWLGGTNGGESNSTTLRNSGLIVLPVVAIYLTWKRIKVAEREALTSRKNLQTASEALDLNYKTLSYTEHRDSEERWHNQHASASERLSSDSMFPQGASREVVGFGVEPRWLVAGCEAFVTSVWEMLAATRFH